MVCCSKNQLKHRHSVLQGALAELAQLAGIPVAMEVALPDGSVPGDVCFRQWDADGPLMVDLTCRHPTPVGSAPPPVDGLAAWFAAQAEDKDSTYLDKCRRAGYSFLPFVVTPWGGLGPEAMRVLLRLQKLALGTNPGWARTRLAQQFWQKLSLAVAKPVARQLTAILQVQEPAWGGGAGPAPPLRLGLGQTTVGSVYNRAPAENHTACVPERTVINATRKGQEGKGGQHPGKPRVRLWGPGGRNHQVERHMNLGFVPEEMPHRGTPAGSPNT